MKNPHRINYLLAGPALLSLMLGCLAVAGGGAARAQGAWVDKVDPWVMETSAIGETTEFLLILDRQADLRGAAALTSKEEKGRFVFERLTRKALETQGPILRELGRMNVPHRPYWVANMIWVEGDRALVEAMAIRADVLRVHANPTVTFEPPVSSGEAPDAPQTVEWGVERIKAPDFWAQGITGQNAVIGGQDTGYDWDHPGLIDQYRGWNGATVNHNYNWHDAIHSGGGVCGPDSPEPCDDGSHGTHTMGTMVGDDGTGNQVGVAPGARWIGCRNMNVGDGTPTSYSECFQWFIAPTDLNDQNPNPAMAPHVVNNSWSCPPSEGCTDPNVMLLVVNNVRAAGITVVVSAGNGGSGCSSVSTPAAIYESSFTVGATTSTGAIAGYSSRGPVTVDGSDRLKPNVSAPGSGIRSTIPGGGYGFKSGTSMAGPHVAGLVGLLISANPTLAGDVSGLEQCIERTAVPKTTAESCGGIPGSQVPNNTFGWGRVEAVWPLAADCREALIFFDGFESGDFSAWDEVVIEP